MDKQEAEKREADKPEERAAEQEADDYEEALKGFDETPLNLSAGPADEEEDPALAEEMKAQYEKFMKEMQAGMAGMAGGGEGDGEEVNMDELGNLLGGLLKGLGQELGEPLGDEMGDKFMDMFKNMNSSNVEQAAGELLNQFMDKSLLDEPMRETKASYQQFFAEVEQGKRQCPESDLLNYRKQLTVVEQILRVLEQEPENKGELVRLFEEMQSYGNPPEGVAPQSTGFF